MGATGEAPAAGAVSGGGGGRAPAVVRRGRATVVGLGSFRGPRASGFGGLVGVGAGSSGGSAWRGGHGHGGRGERSQASGVGKLGRCVRESEAEQSSTARCGSERRSGAREKLRATGVVACQRCQ